MKFILLHVMKMLRLYSCMLWRCWAYTLACYEDAEAIIVLW